MPTFSASIKITGIEDIGIVNKIADVISAYKVTVRNFNYNMDDGMFEGILNIMVPNNDILHGIIKKIHSIKGVLKATRQDKLDYNSDIIIIHDQQSFIHFSCSGTYYCLIYLYPGQV